MRGNLASLKGVTVSRERLLKQFLGGHRRRRRASRDLKGLVTMGVMNPVTTNSVDATIQRFGPDVTAKIVKVVEAERASDVAAEKYLLALGVRPLWEQALTLGHSLRLAPPTGAIEEEARGRQSKRERNHWTLRNAWTGAKAAIGAGAGYGAYTLLKPGAEALQGLTDQDVQRGVEDGLAAAKNAGDTLIFDIHDKTTNGLDGMGEWVKQDVDRLVSITKDSVTGDVPQDVVDRFNAFEAAIDGPLEHTANSFADAVAVAATAAAVCMAFLCGRHIWAKRASNALDLARKAHANAVGELIEAVVSHEPDLEKAPSLDPAFKVNTTAWQRIAPSVACVDGSLGAAKAALALETGAARSTPEL